jgi:hypothetical protein
MLNVFEEPSRTGQQFWKKKIHDVNPTVFFLPNDDDDDVDVHVHVHVHVDVHDDVDVDVHVDVDVDVDADVDVDVDADVDVDVDVDVGVGVDADVDDVDVDVVDDDDADDVTTFLGRRFVGRNAWKKGMAIYMNIVCAVASISSNNLPKIQWFHFLMVSHPDTIFKKNNSIPSKKYAYCAYYDSDFPSRPWPCAQVFRQPATGSIH